MGIGLLFPGQASQFPGMGKELHDAYPVARRTFEEASEALSRDMAALCFRGTEEELRMTENTQPAIFTVSVAAFRVLAAEAGIRPACAAGHSLGEYSALVAAGALPLGEAVRVLRSRGKYMQEAVPAGEGAMAAILGLEDEVVETLCRKILGVWPANYNCPGQIVVSGENDAVDECCERAQEEGARRAVKLKVSGAFHSPLVARAADRLRPAIDRVRFQEPVSPFMSTVTARVESAQRMGPLLVDQLTAPVRFTQAATELMREGVRTFVEVGPGNVLSGLVKRIDRSVKAVSVNNLASLDKLHEALSEA
jgi:malonyl CoA-acyl carrier protein transacylase